MMKKIVLIVLTLLAILALFTTWYLDNMFSVSSDIASAKIEKFEPQNESLFVKTKTNKYKSIYYIKVSVETISTGRVWGGLVVKHKGRVFAELVIPHIGRKSKLFYILAVNTFTHELKIEDIECIFSDMKEK